MNKKYIIEYINSIPLYPLYLNDYIVYEKYNPNDNRYFLLIDYPAGYTLNELINIHMEYQFTYSYFIIEAINSYKKILRDDKIKILIDVKILL